MHCSVTDVIVYTIYLDPKRTSGRPRSLSISGFTPATSELYVGGIETPGSLYCMMSGYCCCCC